MKAISRSKLVPGAHLIGGECSSAGQSPCTRTEFGDQQYISTMVPVPNVCQHGPVKALKFPSFCTEIATLPNVIPFSSGEVQGVFFHVAQF